MKEGYIVLDIETTGLSKDYHKITEIAAIKVIDHNVEDKFETLINPKTTIPHFISRLTGITQSMVNNKPTIDKVLPDFLSFCNDLPIVAHNASFDYSFINENCITHLDKNLINDKICTRKLANRIVPFLPSKKLSTLCDYFDIKNENYHRAMADADATQKVFNQFLNILEQKGHKSRSEILNFEKSKIKK